MIIGAATLTKRKVRAKKLLKDFSAKTLKSDPHMSSIADTCSELINKFPSKATTRDTMVPSWVSISSACPDLAAHYYCHSAALSSDWTVIESRLTPAYRCRSEWLQLHWDEPSLQYLTACDRHFWQVVVTKNGQPGSQDTRIAQTKAQDKYTV
eukprot:1143465-Amphidinium_carterae.1